MSILYFISLDPHSKKLNPKSVKKLTQSHQAPRGGEGTSVELTAGSVPWDLLFQYCGLSTGGRVGQYSFVLLLFIYFKFVGAYFFPHIFLLVHYSCSY